MDRVQQMQAMPPEMVVELYKQTPYWMQLQDRELGFIKFLNEFKAWKPETDDEEDGPSDGMDEREEIG